MRDWAGRPAFLLNARVWMFFFLSLGGAHTVYDIKQSFVAHVGKSKALRKTTRNIGKNFPLIGFSDP